MIKRLFLFAAVGIALSYASDSDTYGERDLTDKIVLITGAAQGIGKSIAKYFHEAGVKLIIILDRETELGEQTAEEFNAIYGENKTIFISCHIPEDLDEVLEYVLSQYEIDILVNNAGEIDENDPVKTVNTNVIGTLKCSMMVSRQMRKDYGGKGGTIMNLSSITGYLVDPFLAYYKASKYAIMGFTKGLGHEYNYKRTGVRVVAICPGFTYTYMTDQQMVTDDQAEIFSKFRPTLPWQEPDCVGSASVQVFQNAESGTCWDSIGCADPTESPDTQIVTSDYLESL